MSTPEEIIANDYEYWLRVVTLIHYGGKKLCHDIFHNTEGYSTDGIQLFTSLQTNQANILKALNKRIIHQDQYDLLFPANGNTNIDLFDITLWTFLFQELFGNKYKTFIKELREWRNTEFHKGNISWTKTEFNNKWNDATYFLKRHGFDIKQITDLKTCTLDKYSRYRNAYLEATLLRIDNQIEGKFDNCGHVHTIFLKIASKNSALKSISLLLFDS